MTALSEPASTSGKNVPPPQGQGAVVEDWTVDKILGGTPLTEMYGEANDLRGCGLRPVPSI